MDRGCVCGGGGGGGVRCSNHGLTNIYVCL